MGIEVRKTSRAEELKQQVLDVTETALTAIGMKAEDYAKLKCPVDTGNLRNSITFSASVEEKVVYLGTNVEYAPYVEMGTSRSKAQPFIKPAIENHHDEYMDIARKYLNSI